MRTWSQVVNKLHASGYSVLQYDQPGHGQSSAPKDITATTFSSLAEDAIELLSHLGIARLAVWIGVSMGAATGMYVAAARPGLIKKLIVSDCPTSAPAVTGVPDPFTPRAEAAREKGGMEEAVDGTMQRWFSADWREGNPLEAGEMRGAMMTTQVDGFRTCIHALTHSSFNLNKVAPNIGRAVESLSLVVGEKDMNLPQTMEALRVVIQNGFIDAGRTEAKVVLRVVASAGHVCYVDNFTGFMDAVGAALDE